MAQHIFAGSGVPAFTPTAIGQHYIDTVGKVSYISVGTSSSADWETSDAAAAIAAHEALSDPHTQYLTAAEGAASFDALGAADSKVSDTITDGVTTVAPSQNAVFDALAGKANSSHTHALSDLTVSGATSGQIVSWNGTNWVPVNAPNSAVWGGITGTLSDQTDLQNALDGKQLEITAANYQMIYQNGSGVIEGIPGFQIESTYGGQSINLTTEPDNESGNFNIHGTNTQIKPIANSPNFVHTIFDHQIGIDQDNDGFNFGTAGQALKVLNHNISHQGSSDIGEIQLLQQNFNLGNGTDSIDVRGFGYAFGFGIVNANVNIVGSMQGYGFQPNLNAAATVDSTVFTNAFYDALNAGCEVNGYTSFNSAPQLASISNNNNFQGLACTPTITTFTGNAGFTGVNVSPTLGTFNSGGYFTGVNVNPTITSARYAAGLNVTMDNVTPYAGVSSSVVIQDLTFEFVAASSFNNSYTIEFVDDGTAGAETVTILGQAIEVHMEAGVSTATQIKAACDGTPSFVAVVTTTISGTGSNTQTAEGPTNFAGGIDPGRILAAYLDGDVEITGSLSFQGALSIGKLSAFASQEIVNGGGVPTTIHGLITQPTVPANATLTSGDTIAVNTAALISIGDNATVGTSFIGLAALGLPAVLTMGAGSTLDRCYASLFALSLDAAAGGGTVDEVGLCRAVAIPNGSTTVNELKGFLFDLPFGDPGTTTWGVYITPDAHNFMAGDLKIGGMDVVSSPNVALEIESTSKAFVLSRMDTTDRNAMTPIAGMVIFNTTTSTLQYYDGTSWV